MPFSCCAVVLFIFNYLPSALVLSATSLFQHPAAAWMGSGGSGDAPGRIFSQYAGWLRPTEFEERSRSALRSGLSSHVSLPLTPSLPLLCLSIRRGSSSSWPPTREGGGARDRRLGWARAGGRTERAASGRLRSWPAAGGSCGIRPAGDRGSLPTGSRAWDEVFLERRGDDDE